MAKAALNMLTYFVWDSKDGMFMNDTGWVTDEDPAELAKKKQELEDFQPPLDIVDGWRVMDPLFDGTGKHWWDFMEFKPLYVVIYLGSHFPER
jgi:predicted AlkP superfamily pyrophosphatase or phosphodiesterase